jgi:hypothetical protein
MMRKFDAISRRFKHHCMRQGGSLEFLGAKVIHDTLDSHDCIVNLRQSFQRSNLDGKVMKANVRAPIKGSGTLVRLPESNHGRSVGQKVAGIRLVPTNPGVSNCFKELEGLFEVTDGEADMTNAGGQLGVCRHAWFLLWYACFFPCFCVFVRLIFERKGVKGMFVELRNASSVLVEANIAQARRSESIKKRIPRCHEKRRKLLEQPRREKERDEVSTTLTFFSLDVFI